MKKVEVKNKYQLISGETIVAEAISLPKLAKTLGCQLSLFYTFKPKDISSPWVFKYKGYEYQIIKIN